MTFDEAHIVIKRGNLARLREALDGGLDPNLSNKNLWTILMVAAMSGNTVIGELLIGRGALLDRRNLHGDSALSLAVHTGHPSFVRLLLHRGASMDCGPNGSPLEDHFDWFEKYTNATGFIDQLRTLFQTERARRAQLSCE